MSYEYCTLDVFTDQRFGGNPLAVVLDARGIDDATMQSIAREFNYSETTFVLPPSDPAHAARVRIFTPGGELPFAGHPTVGTAFALASLGRIAQDVRDLVFEEGIGPVAVSIEPHDYEAEDFRTEKALRRTVLCGEPAFEVQVVVDAAGSCRGACVLAWVTGVPPTVLVTSVEGEEVLGRSLAWLQERRVGGYARLIWAPDRFGRIDLQAAGTIPGTSWVLAAEDGVDFPALWAASLVGIETPACRAQQTLSRSFSIAKPGFHETSWPLLSLRVPWSVSDPLPFIAGLCGIFRRW